jgi:membrane protein
VLLYGAQLAFYHQNPDYLKVGRRTPSMANGVRERLALMTMVLVARDFVKPGHGWRVASLAAHAALPAHSMAPVVQALTDAGLLTETTDDRLIPAKALTTIQIRDVLGAVRRASAEEKRGSPAWDPPVDQIAAQVDQAIDATLGAATLGDLVTHEVEQELQTSPPGPARGSRPRPATSS